MTMEKDTPATSTPGSIPNLLSSLSEAEKHFLSSGKRDRSADLESAVRIFLEFLRGFEFFADIDRPCVTVFGSARFAPGHRYYEMARQLGSQLATTGYAVMTGGGPGIMEAANRGAKEAGGMSLGCNIILPKEQKEFANSPVRDRTICAIRVRWPRRKSSKTASALSLMDLRRSKHAENRNS
jgi:hypothetical protein